MNKLISGAERWLKAGTEYAVPEMLPLPRKWYKDWEQETCNGSARGLTDANIDEGESAVTPLASSCACCIFTGTRELKVSCLNGSFPGVIRHAIGGAMQLLVHVWASN